MTAEEIEEVLAVTVERLGEPGLLATRNTHLMRLLEDLPDEDGRSVCENRGTGIAAMLEALRAAGMEPPKFDDRRTTFRLVFSNASLLDDPTLAWLSGFAGHDLNDAQRLALAYVRREGRMTNADYRRLNPGLDSAEVTRHLADLVRRGLLQQHGTRRWTRYTLRNEFEERPQSMELVQKPIEPPSLSRELGQLSIKLPGRASEPRVRRAVLALCDVRPLTSQELAEQLGRNQTYLVHRYLAPLASEGLLEKVGAAPTDPNLRYQTTQRGQRWLQEGQDLAGE